MDRIVTPQSRCRAGLAQIDITPPIGIYHRMWGAAMHDRATAVHRPLLATALYLESSLNDSPQKCLLLALDQCVLDSAEMTRIRQMVGEALGLAASQVQVTLSHTHGSGWMSRSRASFPGGELLGPYLDELAQRAVHVAVEATNQTQPATIVYGRGRCSLAAHRDYFDAAGQGYVCGYNPEGPADDTLVVARIVGEQGRLVGTVVNYACHPTTLAWENTKISPDYVGALRESVEQHTGAPCLFLQGASGDLGPREGFVGDCEVADRNGRQLAFAALAALEALPRAGTSFAYAGSVISGAILGTWEHRPLEPLDYERQALWKSRSWTLPLSYRSDLPTLEDTRRELAFWQFEEEHAHARQEAVRAGECRARVEQMNRQLARLSAIPEGNTYPYPVSVLRLGDALWIFVPGELYQAFQTNLRDRFPDMAMIVVTLTGDWQPGYLPTAATYSRGIYQEMIASVGPGSLELLIDSVIHEIQLLMST